MFKKIITLIISALVLINLLPNSSALTKGSTWQDYGNYSVTTYTVDEKGTEHKIYWTKGIIPPKMLSYGEAKPQDNYYFQKEITQGKDETYITYNASWVPNKGWYDVRKQHIDFASSQDYGDSDLCAGLTAVNMFYWWANLNMDNIDKFLLQGPVQQVEGLSPVLDFNKYKELQPADYWTSVSNDSQGKVDELVTTFWKKRVFHTDIDLALDHLINGYGIFNLTQSVPPNRPSDFSNRVHNGEGFFNLVFGPNQLTHRFGYNTYQPQTMNYTNISRILKEEIMKGHAIGIGETGFFQGGGRHATNLWGAEYDENDMLVRVFVTDNNNTGSKIGMFSKEVYHNPKDSSSLAYIISKTEIDFNKNNNFIDQIVTLDLGLDMWNSYFNVPTIPTQEATYGDTLASISLPSGYRFKNLSELVGNVGTNSFAGYYNDGEKDYEINIKVKVDPKTISINNVIAEDKIYTNDTSYNGELTVNFKDVVSKDKPTYTTSISGLTNKDAGSEIVNVTVTLTDPNYIFSGNSKTATSHASITTNPRSYEFSYDTTGIKLLREDINSLPKTASYEQIDRSMVSGEITWYSNKNHTTAVTNEDLKSDKVNLYYVFTPYKGEKENKNFTTNEYKSSNYVTFDIVNYSFTTTDGKAKLEVLNNSEYGKSWDELIKINPNLEASNNGVKLEGNFFLEIQDKKEAIPNQGTYNYSLKFTKNGSDSSDLVESGTITIVPKKLNYSLNASDVQLINPNIKYNGSSEFNFEISPISVIDNGPIITHISGSFDNKNAGDNKRFTVLDVTVTNNELGNFELTVIKPIISLNLAKADTVRLSYLGVTPEKTVDGNTSFNGKLILNANNLVGNDNNIKIYAEGLNFESSAVGNTKIDLSKGSIVAYSNNEVVSNFFSNYNGYIIETPLIDAKIKDVVKPSPEPSKPSKPSGGGGGGHKGGGGGGGKKPSKKTEVKDTALVAPNIVISSFDKNTRALKDTLENKFDSYSKDITSKYSNTTELKNAFNQTIMDYNSEVKPENIVYFDLKVQSSTNGKDWNNINSKSMITIPFPPNATLDHDFVVSHMKENGEIEILPVSVSEEGISFTTSSYSPFSVAWSEKLLKAEVLTPAVTTVPATVILDNAIKEVPSTSKTPLIILGVAIVLVGASGIVIYKKKHK